MSRSPHRTHAWLVAGLLLTFTAPAGATHQWGPYHWYREANPFMVDLGSNVDSTWSSHLQSAAGDWSKSVVLDAAVVSGHTKPRQCKAWGGTVQVCNERYGNTGWLGVAGIAVDGDHISAGYVKLNDFYFDTATYDTPAWRQLVTCQEIGHTFGLDHQDENFSNPNLDTCMDYTSSPESNQHPNDHDYEMLEQIYEHLDASSGGGGGGGGGGGCNPRAPWCDGQSAAVIMRNLDLSERSSWGRLVSDHGPHEVYELDLGHGRKIITHVTWTMERARQRGH